MESPIRSNSAEGVDFGTPAYRSRAVQLALHASGHLELGLRWLNHTLLIDVLRTRAANFYSGPDDFRTFFISDEEIDGVFSTLFDRHEVPDSDAESIQQLQSAANRARAELVNAASSSEAPLRVLSERFGLSEFEELTLLFCVAPEIDARYERIFAYLHNDATQRAPTADLVLRNLCPDLNSRVAGLASFHPAGTLRRNRLLEVVEHEPGPQHPIRIDRRTLGFLLGHNAVDSRLSGLLRFEERSSSRTVADETTRNRLRDWIGESLASQDLHRRAAYVWSTRDGIGKKELVGELLRSSGIDVVSLDARRLVKHPQTLPERLFLAFRETVMLPAAVVLEHTDSLTAVDTADGTAFELLLDRIREHGWLTILLAATRPPTEVLSLENLCIVRVPEPSVAQRIEIWRDELDSGSDDGTPRFLAERFRLTRQQIRNAVAEARAMANSDDASVAALPTLTRACRNQSQPKLTNLARKVDPRFTMDDIVLPAATREQLQSMIHEVRDHHLVFHEWGFGSKVAGGRGLTALFAGPSGTGKTMAAEVIARTLDLDLYTIDLSAVTSKYIGETEKNIDRVFAEAEQSNAILFFDEADALFGKRSEVKDAHDRYANVEVAFLLQRMEAFDGITILATNLRRSMDEAFTRRLRITVEFNPPDAAERERIWRQIWPVATPLAKDLDLAFMARNFELSGGNIRNVALAATFSAASRRDAVTMADLVRATQREFQKIGKSCGKTEFQHYFDLLTPTGGA